MNAPFPASLFDPAALLLPQGANPEALLRAGTVLMQLLAQGQAIDAAALRRVMESACGASDAAGAWVWKDAYEACETAPDPVSPALRPRDAGESRHACGHARHAGPDHRAVSDADAPLRGEPSAPAVQHPSSSRLCRRDRGRADAGRRGSGALRRHRDAGDLRRACGRQNSS